MAILLSELKWYGSAVMPDDDTILGIGGAIALTRKFEFADLTVDGLVQAVSSNSGDTTQTVTAHYRNIAGTLLNEVKTLTGLTPVAFAATMRTLMKAIKSATTVGDVAVEAQTAERSNTAQGAGGGTDTIQLDGGASAVNDFYSGMVIRITSGGGANQIAQIIHYVGATKIATVGKPWGSAVGATSVFRISRGMVFEKTPSEILEVRRIFYDVAADDDLGTTRTFYEKFFVKNTHGSLSLTSAKEIEGGDPSGKVTFGVAATLGDTGTNGGANNRQVAPAGMTFDSADKAMAASGVLGAGAAQGVWIKLTLAPGDAAAKSYYIPTAQGDTAA